MAAILIENLWPNLGVVMQNCVTDWANYVVNPAWTFAMARNENAGRKYIETVTNDGTNVTTRRHIINNLKNGQFLSVSDMCSEAGVKDMSPPVLAPAYGARNTNTSFSADFWVPVRPFLLAFGNCGGVVLTAQAVGETLPGFTRTVYIQCYHFVGQFGLVTAAVVTKDPALTTILTPTVLPSELGNPGSTLAAPIGMTDATAQRIATALEALLLKGRDFSFNSGNIHVSSSGSVVGP